MIFTWNTRTSSEHWAYLKFSQTPTLNTIAVNTFFVFVAESYEGGGVDWKFGDGVLALAGAMTCDVNSGSSKSSLKPAKSALEEMPIAANLRSVSVVCCKMIIWSRGNNYVFLLNGPVITINTKKITFKMKETLSVILLLAKWKNTFLYSVPMK